MKKILCVFLLWPTLVLAMPSPCISSQELTELTAEYKELPYVRGVSSEGRSVVIFANAETGSFSIMERKDPNTYCALVVGVRFEPVSKKLQDDLRELQNKGTL